MKKTILLLAAFCAAIFAYAQNRYELASPNGDIKLSVTVSDAIHYTIATQDGVLIENGTMQMNVDSNILGTKPKVISKKTKSVNEKITPMLQFKFSTIENNYNQLLLKFKGNYAIEFRAFDDGVAYRFITSKKGEITVNNELLQFDLPENSTIHAQQSGKFKTSYEEAYVHLDAEAWNKSSDKYTLLPLLIETEGNCKILISESALTDYPAMMLTSKNAGGKVTSIFPPMPIEFKEEGDRSVKLTKVGDYIAKTDGTRSFPWRYFVIVKEDGKIIENTMTARLAEDCKIKDTSWIKPGVTTWEWWNGAVPYGPDVNFRAGCNTETYKYFIDFASKFGIEYVLLDEGWAKSTRDPYTPNSNLDLQELIDYANKKDVGVILWLTWLTVENNFELFEKFAAWGVKGVKIDFMDRSDCWMVNFYERVAAEAAKNRLFVDFHGSFKPAGLEYKYPNVLSYEGVRGMEQMGNCIPDNTLYIPFMRNAVGPMDYTPGAMLSYQPNQYRAGRPNSGSKGTRAYQMALFVVFETGLQMMADNPTLYYQNEDCTRFMADVPVQTDETIALEAKIGKHLIAAKRKGEKWYIGGMANSEGVREFNVTLDFLDAGKEYTMTSYEDGINADVQAMHYTKNVRKVKKGDTVKIRMVGNGGYAAILEIN